MSVYVDPWAAAYNTAYLFTPDDSVDAVGELAEDGSALEVHAPAADAGTLGRPLAFVDGVRRADAVLYQELPDTRALARGAAGSHACGAVLAAPGCKPTFAESRVRRLVIWGSGASGPLPDVDGWSWRSLSTPRTDPDGPVQRLQSEMRQAEQILARELFEAGYLTVLDGPLNNLRSLGAAHLVGYVKTHAKVLLPPERHQQIQTLAGGQRTSVFRLGDERYSCYLRLVDRSPTAPPWAGIVRLEVPADAGLAAAIRLADQLTIVLPRFAGVAHRDPRAPPESAAGCCPGEAPASLARRWRPGGTRRTRVGCLPSHRPFGGHDGRLSRCLTCPR